MSAEINSELVRFRAVSSVTPFDEEPKPLPELGNWALVPGKRIQTKAFEKAVPEADINNRLEATGFRIDESERPIFELCLRKHLAGLLYRGLYSVAAMRANDINEFNSYFQNLSVASRYLPYSAKRGSAYIRRLREADYQALSVIPMETGAIAVGAYFSFFNPNEAQTASDIVVSSLLRVANQKGRGSETVSPSLAGAHDFIEEIRRPDSASLEQYHFYADALESSLVRNS